MKNVSPLMKRWKGRDEYNPYTLRKSTNLPVKDVKRFTKYSALVEVWTGEVWIVPDDPRMTPYETSPYKINRKEKREISGPQNRMTG